MAKKDLIRDALKALLAASGESAADVDAEAGDAVDAIDDDIASLKAQLAERLTARAQVVDGVKLSAAQADAQTRQVVDDTAADLEQQRRDAEHAATLDSFARSHENTTRTPQGVVQTMGLI